MDKTKQGPIPERPERRDTQFEKDLDKWSREREFQEEFERTSKELRHVQGTIEPDTKK